jgi:hypothetical protein
MMDKRSKCFSLRRMSEKVTQYIEVYKTWKSGPASSKTYNQLVTLRESMTQGEQELLARTLISKAF